jgi:hypothetical protein
MRSASFLALILVSAALAGCSGDPGPQPESVATVPASGVVTFEGKPLADHRVVLMPVDGRRPAMGVTDADGKFTLGTNAEADGAPPGKSKVGIVWVGPPMPNVAALQNPIDDPAKMPKPDVKIPAKYTNPETSELTADIPEDGTSELKFELQ